MTDAAMIATVACSGLLGLGIVAATVLRGWAGWLDLQRAQIAGSSDRATASSPGQRIEIADLKERIRKLEAIAAGVDL